MNESKLNQSTINHENLVNIESKINPSIFNYENPINNNSKINSISTSKIHPSIYDSQMNNEPIINNCNDNHDNKSVKNHEYSIERINSVINQNVSNNEIEIHENKTDVKIVQIEEVKEKLNSNKCTYKILKNNSSIFIIINLDDENNLLKMHFRMCKNQNIEINCKRTSVEFYSLLENI